jgi:hypothetical protein
MSKPNRSRVRLSQFNAQVEERIGPKDGLTELVLEVDGQEVVLLVRLGSPIAEDHEDFEAKVKELDGEEGLARLILSYDPNRDADEALDLLKRSGGTVHELAMFFGAESRAVQERLGNFRFKG